MTITGDDVMTKTCTKCGEERPRSEFHNDKNRKDGKYPQCKPCVLKIHRGLRDKASDGRTAKVRMQRRAQEDLIRKGFKLCSSCGQVLPLDSYHNKKSSGDGKSSKCKDCANAAKMADYQKHRKARLEYQKKEREQNPEKVKAAKRSAYLKRRQHYLSKSKLWVEENREKARESKRRWYDENRSLINEKLKQRYREDPDFRAAQAMRQMLYKFIERSSGAKSGKTHELLGYSYDQFKRHIEAQFRSGMNWANHGDLWHIDHIIPVSDFLARGELDPSVVNCLTNLQPMLAEENIRKSNNILYLL